MKAAVFEQLNRPLVVKNVADPTPGPEEVVVEVCRCGICGTDLHLTSEPIFGLPEGAVLGHEYAGRIVATGEAVDRIRVGDHVAVLPLRGCGRCASCLAGEPAWCSVMRVDSGGYGQFSLATQQQCLTLPRGVALEDGALVEPLAVGLHGVRLARPDAGSRVLIIGAGPIGLAAAYWSRRLGAGPVAVTASSTRRADLAISMGASVFVDPEDSSPDAVTAALGGPPDVVYDCVGQPGTLARSIDQVRPRGTVVVLGLCVTSDSFIPFGMVTREVRVLGAIFYDRRDFELAADALSKEAHIPRAMVTDIVGLDDLPAAFEALRRRSTQCKVLVNPSQG